MHDPTKSLREQKNKIIIEKYYPVMERGKSLENLNRKTSGNVEK